MALIDFSDIVTAIRSEMKIPESDTVTMDRIKLDINMIYVDEVVPFKRWLWLTGHTKVIHRAFYGAGTANITNNSTTVTLSVAPPVGNGSYTDFFFASDSFDEVYQITDHTAGSDTITLSSAYQSITNTTSAFKIWTDRVNLPTDAREVVEAYHQRNQRNMEGVGFQEFRRIVTRGPKGEGLPCYFNVAEYVDPTPLTDMTETDRYRIMRVHPAVTTEPVTIDIDYTREVSWLVDDGDEPILPLEDRIVLVYGALSRAWGRERNEERATYNWQLFQAKLGRMAGKIEDGFDKPTLSINRRWLASKRGPRVRGFSRRYMDDFAGSASYVPPSYLENVTINGANVTNNITVVTGKTIDGRDISVDGAALDAHIAASSGVHGVAGNVVGDTDTQTLTNKTIATGSNAITASASRAASFDVAGDLQADAITINELSYLSAVEPLTPVTLVDNQASAATIFSLAATYNSVQVWYSIKRGSSNIESGWIILTNDGSTADVVPLAGDVGSSGVTLSADVSAGNVRLRYTSTSTGTAPSFKYKLHKWAA